MTFQMQSYRSQQGEWVPMEDGAAPKHWRPRKTRFEAVHQCLGWTGLVCIPAMRVVDLSTGEVIWQDRWDDGKDGALDQIIPPWAESIYRQVKAEQQTTQDVIDRAVDEYVPGHKPTPVIQQANSAWEDVFEGV